jgi:hypothetical protein
VEDVTLCRRMISPSSTMPQLIEAPTVKDIIEADALRLEQARDIALLEVGPEPEQGTCLWMSWLTRFHIATERAARRIN